jgi:hypothetical protein
MPVARIRASELACEFIDLRLQPMFDCCQAFMSAKFSYFIRRNSFFEDVPYSALPCYLAIQITYNWFLV